MVGKTGADVVIGGTEIVGCLIAEQMLDAGLSVLMLGKRGHASIAGASSRITAICRPPRKFTKQDGLFPTKALGAASNGLYR